MNQGHGIGDRIREARKRHGLSQRELARLSGVSHSLISKLEQGERLDTRTETLRRLAASLHVPTMALLGDAPPAPPIPDQPAWEPVHEALIAPVTADAAEPVTDEGMTSALTGAVKLYHDNQYATLAAVLPGLLTDAQHSTPVIRSRVLQLTGSLMIQTRQRDTARLALTRSLADAETAGSTLDAASAIITTCWLLLMERQFGQVRTLALHWADRIEPKLSTASTAELSTWGWLLLRASAAAARDNRPDEAVQIMRLAEAAAIAVGRDRGSYHSYWTTYGPATVAMKQVENAVVEDKPDLALALAGHVPPTLRPTSDNRNRHLLDVSAAHLQLRRYPDAFDVLYRLSREAPVWLENQQMAKDLLKKIVARRRTLTPQMRELAQAVHLPL